MGRRKEEERERVRAADRIARAFRALVRLYHHFLPHSLKEEKKKRGEERKEAPGQHHDLRSRSSPPPSSNVQVKKEERGRRNRSHIS